jgi:hypothetical protein
VPISYRVSGKLVLTHVEGAVTVADVRAYLGAVRSDPAYRAGMSTLIDCRNVTTLLSSEELRIIAADIQHLTTSRARGRCAILAPSEAGFGLLRMYEAYSEGAPVEVRAFRERDEAMEWLEDAPDVA